MALTPLDIQHQRFRMAFRGYNTQEVEAFLEQAANACEDLQRENLRLLDQMKKALDEKEAHQRREGAFKLTLLHSQKVLEQMQENARREAELIVAEAKTKADKLLLHAQNRLAQLQEAIVGLKRQRVQLEAGIAFVIDSHRRLLEVGLEATRGPDAQDEKLIVLNPPK